MILEIYDINEKTGETPVDSVRKHFIPDEL